MLHILLQHTSGQYPSTLFTIESISSEIMLVCGGICKGKCLMFIHYSTIQNLIAL